MKILCVDDRPDILEVYQLTFETPQFEVIEALSADQAIRILAEEEKINCILSDYKMPQKDGVDFRKEILGTEHESIPFYFVTSEPSGLKSRLENESLANETIFSKLDFTHVVNKVHELKV